jgi:retinol-binding protein 3
MLDAVTKTHFEGIGVKPDIAVSAKDALLTAQIVALEKLSAKFPDNKANYDWHLQALRAKQKPVSVSDETLKSYIGKYGIITLLWENGKLISLREGIKTELIPIAQDLFLLEGRDDARFRILFENGKVAGLERLFEDGRSLKEAKEK